MAKNIAKQNTLGSPLISIVMSVYNGAEYLRLSIDSIFNQTFRDFELIIIDDGSNDDTLKILKSYKDSRIQLISRKNKGLVASLNEGIGIAKGKYIARQDADDISAPKRLQLQYEFLERIPNVGMVGSNYEVIDDDGKKIGESQLFTHPKDLAVAQIVSNQFAHGSVMMRADLVKKIGSYSNSVGYVEDYDLWCRMSGISGLANLPEMLYRWRDNPFGISTKNAENQRRQFTKAQKKYYESLRKHPEKIKAFDGLRARSFRGGKRGYLHKKSKVYRGLAYLSMRANDRRLMMRALQKAWMCQPLDVRSRSEYLAALRQKDMTKILTYESV